MSESWNHPAHYGGKDNPYEAIKVIEAWGLGFRLGNTVKYISRAEKKNASIEDLKKARWYLDREIATREAAAPGHTDLMIAPEGIDVALKAHEGDPLITPDFAAEDARSREEFAYRNDPERRYEQTPDEIAYGAFCERRAAEGVDEISFEVWRERFKGRAA